MRGENRSTRGKTHQKRVGNQQTQSTHEGGSGCRTRTTQVEGGCSHYCANPAAMLMTMTMIMVRVVAVTIIMYTSRYLPKRFVLSHHGGSTLQRANTAKLWQHQVLSRVSFLEKKFVEVLPGDHTPFAQKRVTLKGH